MQLIAHYDAAYLNFSKEQIRYGSHILLSKDEPKPWCNGPILTIYQIIKFVMYSAAEAEIASLLITFKDMVPLRQTLI